MKEKQQKEKVNVNKNKIKHIIEVYHKIYILRLFRNLAQIKIKIPQILKIKEIFLYLVYFLSHKKYLLNKHFLKF